MSLPTSTLAWMSLGLLLSAVAAVAAPVLRESLPKFFARTRGVRSTTTLAIAAIVFLLLRPHEDTFSGLDASGYRHMAAAFRDGRGLHDADTTLLIPPLEIREAFLLMPNMNYRNTRDRSFQILSLQRAETEPFFYPLVPLAASAFDRLVTGARDYLLPALHAFLVACIVLAAAGWGGGVGLALAVALLLATPLPAWFLRGYFPEALGALLVSLAVLHEPASQRGRMAQSFALGFSMSLHPLLVIMAGPVFGIRWLIARFSLVSLAGFLAGLLPLYAMTRWMCTPYGDFFKLDVLRFNMSYSGEHRAVIGFALSAAVLLVVTGVALWIRTRLGRARSPNAQLAVSSTTLWNSPLSRLLLVLGAFLPFIIGVTLPDVRPVMLRGMQEAWTGVRMPGACLLGLLALLVFLRAPIRHRWPLTLALAILPVCFFLKGGEVQGLWHQRRLLPGFLMLSIALIPSAHLLDEMLSRLRRTVPARAFATVALLALGLANAFRWPALYLARNEAGAQAWIDRVAEAIGSNLTFFDYHPFSFPLAVDLRRPVLGLGEDATAFVPGVMNWLSSAVRERPVQIATAYANPGVEVGLKLIGGTVVSAEVTRIRSRAVLPAEAFARSVSVELLEARSADDERPALHKIFDGGPLALRGPWISRVQRIRNSAGESVPAQWFRDGASVIGPSAEQGQIVLVRVFGVAGQRDPAARQRIEIFSEDGVALGEVELGHDWTEAEIRVPGSGSPPARTARYILRAPTPYDPAREGLRGYPNDLGALLHRIDMNVESAHTVRDE